MFVFSNICLFYFIKIKSKTTQIQTNAKPIWAFKQDLSKEMFMRFAQIWNQMAGMWFMLIWNCGDGPITCPSTLMCCSAPSLKKIEQNKKFQCQASEALGLLPVLVHLVKTFLLPNDLVCPQICKAFLACAENVDLVHLGQTWGVCTPEALQQAAEMCLASWMEANLQDHMIKKFHWTLHLGPALARFKKIPACFAMERKHCFICRFASNNICNTAVYEHTLL